MPDKDVIWKYVAIFCGLTALILMVLLLFPWDEPRTQIAREVLDASVPPPTHEPHMPPPASAVVDIQEWDTVTDLEEVRGMWVVEDHEEHGGRLQVRRRQLDGGMEGAYKGIYPWRLDYEPPRPFDEEEDQAHTPMRCGFYPKMHQEWRVAYCTGYDRDEKAGAYAERLFFHKKYNSNKELKVQVGNRLEVFLKRERDESSTAP